MKKTDLAYAAGLVDGEGCITIVKNKDNRCHAGFSLYLRVIIGMATCDSLTWVNAIFGGSLYSNIRQYQTYTLVVYQWAISCKQALRFLESILPYLKDKQNQARVAIEFQRGKHLGGYKKDELIEKEVALYEKIRDMKNDYKKITIGEEVLYE